jgi:hypothetical protein
MTTFSPAVGLFVVGVLLWIWLGPAVSLGILLVGGLISVLYAVFYSHYIEADLVLREYGKIKGKEQELDQLMAELQAMTGNDPKLLRELLAYKIKIKNLYSNLSPSDQTGLLQKFLQSYRR